MWVVFKNVSLNTEMDQNPLAQTVSLIQVSYVSTNMLLMMSLCINKIVKQLIFQLMMINNVLLLGF